MTAATQVGKGNLEKFLTEPEMSVYVQCCVCHGSGPKYGTHEYGKTFTCSATCEALKQKQERERPSHWPHLTLIQATG